MLAAALYKLHLEDSTSLFKMEMLVLSTLGNLKLVEND